MARKQTYDKKVADDICEWLSKGKTLAAYCAQPNAPSYATVYGWREAHEEFRQNYAHAREVGHDVIADDCLKIADEMPPPDEKGRMDSGFVAWQRNRIYTRERLLRSWSPKRYGDAKQIEVSGPNGGPIQTQTVIDTKDLDQDAKDALRYAMASALSKGVQGDDEPYQDDEE